jgi:hypothetical protein
MHAHRAHPDRMLRWVLPIALIGATPALSYAQTDPGGRGTDPGSSVHDPHAPGQNPESAPETRAVPEHEGKRATEPTYGIMSPRIALRTIIGLRGTANIDGYGDANLDTTYGGAVEIEVPALPFLSFGAEIGVMAWTPDLQADLGHNILTNIALVPRLRIPFGGRLMHGAFYVGAPFGMTTSSLSDRFRSDFVGSHVDAGVGFNYGGRAGMQLFVTPRFGFAADAEYRVHNLQHRIGAAPADAGELDIKLRQLVVNAGLIFTL